MRGIVEIVQMLHHFFLSTRNLQFESHLHGLVLHQVMLDHHGKTTCRAIPAEGESICHYKQWYRDKGLKVFGGYENVRSSNQGVVVAPTMYRIIWFIRDIWTAISQSGLF